MELAGKSAIVTGAGRGIGKTIALRLAEEGARVMVDDIDPATAEQTASEISSQGGAASWLQADVTKNDQVTRLVNETVKQFGGVDILVNNAGMHRFKPFLEVMEQDWNDVSDLNMKAAFLCGQAAAREMVKAGKGGKMVNICSVASKVGIVGQVPYCATKAGLEGLTRVMALELAPHRINVNGVGPGTIKTEMTRFRFEDPKGLEWLLQQMVIGRPGETTDIAEAVLFLVSARSDFITGHLLMVDGGWTIH